MLTSLWEYADHAKNKTLKKTATSSANQWVHCNLAVMLTLILNYWGHQKNHSG